MNPNTKINSKNIKLFKDLSQIEMNNITYDLHNNFYCTQITYNNAELTLYFKEIETNVILYIKFYNVKIKKINFVIDKIKCLTIDSLYRGRFEHNNKLLEFNSEDKSFFYIDFYEGFSIELWSDILMFHIGNVPNLAL